MTNFLVANGFTVVKLQEFNEYGVVSLRVLSRIMSRVLKSVGRPRLAEPGAEGARSGAVRKSMRDSVAGWMWVAYVKTAVVLDAPIYAFLRLVGAPRQMLYCVARKDGGDKTSAMEVHGAPPAEPRLRRKAPRPRGGAPVQVGKAE